MDVERKGAAQAERNRLISEKNDFDKLAKTRDWRLDVRHEDWLQTVRQEHTNISRADKAPQKVRELQKIIKDGEEALKWDTSFFEFKEQARAGGFLDSIKDIVSPIEEKKYNEQGEELKSRIEDYRKIMNALIKRFSLTEDMITSAGSSFTGGRGTSPSFTIEKVE